MEFSPTYLYIKQHAVTGLLYFGKTTQKDPIKYLGSGRKWCNHIKKHGKEHVVTLWFELFTDKDELTLFAQQFSRDMDIIKSKSWANLCIETGFDGPVGYTHTSTTKAHMSERKLGISRSEETKIKISSTLMGHRHSEETKNKFRHPASQSTRDKMSKSQRGRKNDVVSCPHCCKSGGSNTMKRWHFDKCKHYPPISMLPEAVIIVYVPEPVVPVSPRR